MTIEEKRLEEAMSIEERTEELVQLSLHTSSLDDLVHDCKDHEAAVINNGGCEEQLEYLREFYGRDSLALLVDLEKLFSDSTAQPIERGEMR